MCKIMNIIIINLFYVYESLLGCMYVYQRHIPGYQWMPEEGFGSPANEIKEAASSCVASGN